LTGSGLSAIGTVSVIVEFPTGNGPSVVSVTVSDGKATVTFAGIPGLLYYIQASTDLVNWVDLGSVTAGPTGVIQFTDVNAGQYAVRYYRTSATP
jgi:hypothetical protein